MTLEIEGLGFSYGDRRVLDDLDLEMGKGVTAILGPNGAGKSTLVKCIAGVHRPDGGTIRFDGHDMLSGRRDGPSLAYLSQELPRTVGATVLEVMLLGRVRTLSISVTEEDIEKCYGALELLHLEDLAPRDLGELSTWTCAGSWRCSRPSAESPASAASRPWRFYTTSTSPPATRTA